MTLKRKDGTEKTVEVNASIIHQKRRLGLLAIVRDVTERKQAMEALVESEEKYHSLFENMLNGFAYCKIILDSAGKPVDFVYLEVNDAFETLTGLKKEDVIGKNATEVIPGIKEAHPELFEIYGRVAITGKHEKFEIHFAPFDMWLSILVYSTKKEHFAAVFENITEEKKLKQIIAEYSRGLEFTVTEKQRELEETQNRLAEAGRLAAIGELAGMIGHDLRNPLTAMKNAAYYLQTKGPICSDDKKDTMLQVINSSVDHANKIINDLLDYSRRMQLEFQECSPTSLATQALALANVPNRITVINNLQEKPSFYVDKDKMLRVFVNLIKNAVDAMPNQGTLHISSKQKGHKIELVFSDTGTGIPNEIKSKMFTPLLTTKAQGMGFGLAICKRIVDAHGGEIYAESGNGKGARFIITLPILPKTQL
jgi:PAS domain S-box-containing protein